MESEGAHDPVQLGQVVTAAESASSDQDDFGTDIEYDEELEETLQKVEIEASLPATFDGEDATAIVDIEDVVQPSPFSMFRKKGFLSVSDLVGTVWCEVQYDYRLRTLPFLPPSQRPEVITTPAGKEITVDKVKVEDKERILRRGEKIHKRLEREIHPEAIIVTAITREDVWGLRFLNMLSAFEALLVLGKCRELPVVGFVRDVFVMGIIDELTRVPVDGNQTKRDTRSSTDTSRQTSLTSFFSPTKPKPESIARQTHKVYISDSKTRASGTLPRDSDTLAGRLQVMLYKELLDAILTADLDEVDSDTPGILPSQNKFSWSTVFAHLELDPTAQFSDQFSAQSKPVVSGNALRFGAKDAGDLNSMVIVWNRYVAALGLGREEKGKEGKTEEKLELVYRRAAPLKVKTKKGQGKRRGRKRKTQEVEQGMEGVEGCGDEDRAIQMTIENSLRDVVGAGEGEVKDKEESVGSDGEKPEEEMAWATEMTTNGLEVGLERSDVPVRSSQQSSSSSPPPGASSPTASAPSLPTTPNKSTASGSIIGRSTFIHDQTLLTAHLESVLGYWMGERIPKGVEVHEASRCAWCEFEEGCEWRAMKAEEAMKRYRERTESAR